MSVIWLIHRKGLPGDLAAHILSQFPILTGRSMTSTLDLIPTLQAMGRVLNRIEDHLEHAKGDDAERLLGLRRAALLWVEAALEWHHPTPVHQSIERPKPLVPRRPAAEILADMAERIAAEMGPRPGPGPKRAAWDMRLLQRAAEARRELHADGGDRRRAGGQSAWLFTLLERRLGVIIDRRQVRREVTPVAVMEAA